MRVDSGPLEKKKQDEELKAKLATTELWLAACDAIINDLRPDAGPTS